MIWIMTLHSRGQSKLADISNVKLGALQIQKIYAGNDLLFEIPAPDAIKPITTPRPAAGTYDSAQTVWLDVNEAGVTYYSIDGSEPSIQYIDGILLDGTTTLKYFTVDLAGNAEDVKTAVYTISSGWRYIRYQGFGDSASAATSRLVELQAIEGATNRLLNKTPISGEPVSAGAAIGAATDGNIVMTSGTYPLWWNGSGIPTLTYDLGAAYPIDTLKLWMFSTVNDPRQTKFKLLISKDNAEWFTVADKSLNTEVQPADGWAFVVSF